MAIIYQNYHKHTMYSNLRVADSTATYQEYVDRAKELGQGILSSCEHGFQGMHILVNDIAKANDLKFVLVAEAYWVKNRFEKDRANCHIILAAKNENGRQCINEILADAVETGFYGQPRVDRELILSLPPEDVLVTTACVAFWRYEDVDEFVLELKEHFKDNFYLEVQYHETDSQRKLNRHILDLHYQYNIPLIMGCDSHYIHPEEAAERDNYLESKGMVYEDEAGWYMDFPTGDEAYNRFVRQGVLNHDEIMEAIENTNVFLTFEDYDSPVYDYEIKMPTIYPELTQEEKDQKLADLIWSKWNEEKQKISPERWEEYESEIRKELDTIFITKHADYFLLNYEIIREGIKRGGQITLTGRGSAVSFYVNKLLGFTTVDRISAPVKMFPERFMSPTRVLQTKSLADIDFNVADQKPFEEAQEYVMGHTHSYVMIALGTQKQLAAWKMYARAKHIDFEISNRVSAGIEKYNMAVKHADDDDKDSIDITKYIPAELANFYEESKKYQGIITDSKKAPCSYLLYNGNIRREIGLFRAKDNVCCLMDKNIADQHKYLKNDILIVAVVKLYYKIFERIGIKPLSIDELREQCDPLDVAWNMYKIGATCGLNQVAQRGATAMVSRYAPTNISELCGFVAAIRPGFKSMLSTYLDRENFEYGIPSFDNLIQTPEMPNSFVLYQEMAMETLNYAGIDMAECYAIIKAIAKKKVQEVFKRKEEFLKGFAEKIMIEEFVEEAKAHELAEQVWQILEDSSGYSFNCSHSYCVAGDSLYNAWQKAHYPLEFYECFLQILDEDGEKDKMAATKEEAQKCFNITFPLFRWGQDNRSIVADKATNSITNSLTSIKGMSQSVADGLYEVAQLGLVSLAEIFVNLKEHGVSMAKIAELIKIDYFAELGNIPTVSRIFQLCELLKWGEAKSIKGEKIPAFKDIALKYAKNTNADGEVTDTYTFTNERVEKYKKQATAAKRALTKAQKAGENTEILQGEYDLFCTERDEACRELVMGFLTDCEDFIKAQNLSDLSFAAKAANQLEILGDIDLTTGKEEDRHKLYVTDIYPLVAKKTGTVWAYSVKTKSIGRGRLGRWTIKAAKFEIEPVKKGDIIEFDPKTGYYTDKKGDQTYYTLVEYQHVFA